MCGPCRWHVRNIEYRQNFGCKTWKETTDEMIMSKCIRQTGWGSVYWVHLAQDIDQGSSCNPIVAVATYMWGRLQILKNCLKYSSINTQVWHVSRFNMHDFGKCCYSQQNISLIFFVTIRTL
jgi:hypothetical protein